MAWSSNKYRILNLILFAVVLSAAGLNYEIWSHSNGSAKELAQKTEVLLGSPSEMNSFAVIEGPQSIHSYSVINEKNIFSQERKDFPSSGLALAELPNRIVRPQVNLHGVAISDDYQSASVSSPGRPLKKGERETMTLKPGDKIGEYRLATIEADRITLEAGEDSFEVLLYDPRNPKKRVEMKTGIQAISETKTTQPAPAVDPAKVEAAEKPLGPEQEKAIASASSLQWKEVPPSEVRWRKVMRLSRMPSN